MKRRTFILASSATAVAIAVPWAYIRYENSKWKKEPLMHPLVLSYFCDEETIKKIGRVYRKVVPSEDSHEKLSTLLLSEARKADPVISVNTVEDRQLKMLAEEDFKSQNLLILNGWVLSLTEARQCALLSLS